MKKAEIPCPEVVLLRKHILVMSFIGKDHVPAPKLKDVALSGEDMKKAFFQVLYVGPAALTQFCRSRRRKMCSSKLCVFVSTAHAAAVSGV